MKELSKLIDLTNKKEEHKAIARGLMKEDFKQTGDQFMRVLLKLIDIRMGIFKFRLIGLTQLEMI